MYKFFTILLFTFGIAVTTNDIYDNSYALIIGIDKYDNVSNLDYAVDDANSIRNLLIEQFRFSPKNVTLLINEKATYTTIKKSLSYITTQTGENDRILVFFAGHGETIDLPEGGEMGFLIPVDGEKGDLYGTSLEMDELRKVSSLSKAKHILYLVDACYGGLAAINARALDVSSAGFIDKITRNKSRQIITAGGRGEPVIEKAEWGHSAFTLNILRGLKDWNADLNWDGIVTGDELGLFLKDKVTIDSENKQTPQSRRFTSHEGEFVFINHKLPLGEGIPIWVDGEKDNKRQKDFTLSQLGILENNKISIHEWNKYKENGVSFDNFITYKHEIKYKSKALVRSILFPGWGQYYTENTARGLIYSSSFIFGVINIVCSPKLLNIPPFNDPLTGKILLLYTSIISYGMAPLDAVVSVNIYNRELQKKYNIGFTPFHHHNQVSVNLSYIF